MLNILYDIILLEPFTLFHVTCDSGDSDSDSNVTLTLALSPQKSKIKKKKITNEKREKIK